MATILLTDEEYQYAQTLLTDLTSKIPVASPRAATLYSNLARMASDFLAREDGKRSLAKTKAAARENITQAKKARLASASGRPAAQPTPQQSTATPGQQSRSRQSA